MADPELYSGRYEILRHIARGGMAEVYLARDHLLDRPVALKGLFTEYARDEAFVERFRREAKAAANLNQPNIVAVYDWGEDDGLYFIVMEYVEGLSLRELIHDEGTLLPQRAAEIGADVATALDYAHRHGVVHRDVKPGNILLTTQGQVKVTDFGIARAGRGDSLTRTGMVMGTATYFSPEQAQGLDVDPRSDVYSLGIVTYEMVTGVAPFTGDDPVAIAYQHVREDPMPPGIRNPDVPMGMEQIILTALSKSPADRYQSAEEMRADFTRFATGHPVQAAPVTAMVDEVADATVMSPGAADGDHTSVTPTSDAPRPSAQARRKRRLSPVAIAMTILLLVIGGLGYLLADQLDLIGDGSSIAVPDVVTLELEEARAELEAAGFTVETKLVEDDQVPENQVFGQDPEGGSKAEEGSAVTLTVSQGAGQVQVPDVTGEERERARRILAEAGFQINEEEESSDAVEPGRVVRTDPAGKSQARKGTAVTMFVSSGVEPIEVPILAGEDAVKAAATLASVGFEVSTVDEASESVPEGKVIRTDPAGGDVVPKGSTVTLIVSSGAAPATVPSVLTMTPQQAEQTIKNAGLKPKKATTTSCDLTQDNTVVDQDPAPSTQAAKNSTVTYFVCTFKP